VEVTENIGHAQRTGDRSDEGGADTYSGYLCNPAPGVTLVHSGFDQAADLGLVSGS